MAILIFFLSCKESDVKNPVAGVKNKKQSQFFIHGAYALYPLAQIWADAYKIEHPEVRITVFPASSTKGKADVELGLAEIGMYSNPLTDFSGDNLIVLKVAKDAVIPTINPMNPDIDIISKHGITPDMFNKIFITGTVTHWDQVTGSDSHKPITVFTRSDASGAAAAWAEFLDSPHERLSGIGVYGDAGITQAIRSNIYSIGYDNLRFVFDNKSGLYYPEVAVPPIDFNSDGIISDSENLAINLEKLKNGIRSGEYPYPLSRALFLLVHPEQDNPFVRDFLVWVFNEGRLLIDSAGYVDISEKDISIEKAKIADWIN